jgi:sortase A
MRGWRWWVGRLGRVLIATGILVLLFAAYQLWGTGLQTAIAQDDLEHELDQALASASTVATTTSATTSSPGTTAPGTTAPPTTAPPPTAPPAPPEGEALAKIDAPTIGLDFVVVEGVGVADLRKGPGHYPGTALPGVEGNVAIAGHRTTYQGPFEDIDRLKPGDPITLTSVTGSYTYKVTGTRIVPPSETSVLAQSDDALLTLTSCHPKYSARERIIVTAAFDPTSSSPLLSPASAAPPSTVPADTTPSTIPGEDPTVTSAAPAPTTVPDEPVVSTSIAAGTFTEGWVSDPDAWGHLAIWGVALTIISVGAWLLGRRIPQWAAALIGLPFFLVALYFFFDNVNRLLPPNL